MTSAKPQGHRPAKTSRIELRSTEDDRALLAARHQLAGFRCRSKEQTAWLVELAKQAHGTGRYPQPVALLQLLSLLKDIRRTLAR